MGVVFLLIGIVPLIISIRRKNFNAQLLQTGRAIQAKVTSVEFNQVLTVNTVYIDENNPKHDYVDLAFLPPVV